MNKYITYKQEDGSFLQLIECTEDEILCFEKSYIMVDKLFELKKDTKYVVENEVLVEYPLHTIYDTIAVINSDYVREMKSKFANIPDDEVLTFPIQKEEAKAWFKDNNEPTPFIDGMLTKRTDVTKAQLVDKIIEKANVYAYAVGVATGARQAKEKEILKNKET